MRRQYQQNIREKVSAVNDNNNREIENGGERERKKREWERKSERNQNEGTGTAFIKRVAAKMRKLTLVQVEFIIVLKLEKWHLHNIQLLSRQPRYEDHHI